MLSAILVDSSTNRLSGFALDVQIASKSVKVAGNNAFVEFKWSQMPSHDWEQHFGGF